MKYLILVPLLVLVGCAGLGAPPLDTNNKKLLAAETGVQELAKLVLQSKDRLSESGREQAKCAVTNAGAAVAAARVALSVGDEVDFTNHLTTANSIITIVRPILLQLEGDDVSLELDYCT